jgi:hypothetical protein
VTGEVPTLWHLRVSNFNEKARCAAEWRSLPAGAWVMRTYERYRPPSVEVGA